MKKRQIVILILLGLLLIGCKEGNALSSDIHISDEFNGLNQGIINEYEIEVILNDEEKSYNGNQLTKYVNNSEDFLEEIYFHIYPNAFKSLDTAPTTNSNPEDSDPLSYIGGYIDILEISSKENILDFEIIGEDQTILKINLEEALEPGEEIDLSLSYFVKLPTAKDRFGYSKRVMNFGNWYPIACVYDEYGWNTEPYYTIGDPFYSNVANYKVRIVVPKDLIVASSGNILSEEEGKENKTYEIEGKLMRDFAWVASKEFRTREATVDEIQVKLYYLDNRNADIKHALNAGVNSIRIFNESFGKYPYGQYSIVMTEFPSGMEYPGIVFISNDYILNPRQGALEKVIVHETAHQWWYGIVGSNQVKEAWLDESLSTYSEVIYYRKNYDEDRATKYFNQNIRDGFDYGSMYLNGDTIVNKHLSEFVGWNDYGILVYLKGAMFFEQINRDYGEEVLYEILSTYFDRYRFLNARTEDLLEICEEVTGENFSDIEKEWLGTNRLGKDGRFPPIYTILNLLKSTHKNYYQQ